MYTKLGGENSLSVVFFGQLDLGKVVDFFNLSTCPRGETLRKSRGAFTLSGVAKMGRYLDFFFGEKSRRVAIKDGFLKQ